MQPVVFSRAWFQQHQRPLLAALNTPVIGGELRAALGILSRQGIVQIRPHAYLVDNRDGTQTLDVRTHAKFAKRLRHQFAPIWRAAHAWDRFVANPLVPALNVGFDTLTVYPDPDPEVTSFDGNTDCAPGASQSYAVVTAGPGIYGEDATLNVAVELKATAITNEFQYNRRFIALFDTSALAGALVTAATVSLKPYGASLVPFGTYDLHLVSSAPASNTAIGAGGGDYSSIGSVSFGSAASASWTDGGPYVDITLNASGRAAINTTGITKFGGRDSWDMVGTFGGAWVSGAKNNIPSVAADNTGSSEDPKLTVTYTPNIWVARARSVVMRPAHFSPGIAR